MASLNANIEIGMIGVGKIAREHIKVLQALPQVKVTSCCGRNGDSGKRFGEEYGIPLIYRNLDDLLEHAKVDVLWVTVSADQIYPVALRCLETGLPLFLEKPVGLASQETAALASKAAAKRCTTMIGLNRRFYSNIRRGLEIAHEFGGIRAVWVHAPEDLRVVESRFSHLRNRWIYANGIHCIDLLRYIGGEPTSVISNHTSWEGQPTDSFVALIRFQSGAVGQYTSHWYSPGRWRVSIYAEGACILIEPLESARVLHWDKREEPIPLDQVDIEFKPGFYAQARYFLTQIREGRPVVYPGSDLADNLKTMQLIDQIVGEKVGEEAPPQVVEKRERQEGR